MHLLVPVDHNSVERTVVLEPLQQAVQDLSCKRKSIRLITCEIFDRRCVEFVLVCSSALPLTVTARGNCNLHSLHSAAPGFTSFHCSNPYRNILTSRNPWFIGNQLQYLHRGDQTQPDVSARCNLVECST